MKIGIVTFQRTTNFGAIMQCYALNKKIRNLGAECETIDYHNKKNKSNKKIYNKWKEFNCNKFTNLDRNSDITLADAWGNFMEGCWSPSLIIINTKKGQELFEKNKNQNKI